MKKLMNKKAFTIMEMLIVVAIIAVLVAIAIPTFTSSLTKAKEAADVANVRAAYAEIQIDYLTNGTPYPTDKTNFLTKVEGGKLNDDNKLTSYKAPTSTEAGEIVYTATVLTNEKTNTKVFTWELEQTN